MVHQYSTLHLKFYDPLKKYQLQFWFIYLSNIIHPNLAHIITNSYMKPRWGPGYSIEGWAAVNNNARSWYLGLHSQTVVIHHFKLRDICTIHIPKFYKKLEKILWIPLNEHIKIFFSKKLFTFISLLRIRAHCSNWKILSTEVDRRGPKFLTVHYNNISISVNIRLYQLLEQK